MARVPLLLALVASVSGCYLAHERPEADAASTADAGTDAALRPCTWRAGEAWQLTAPPGDQQLLDLVAVPGGDFVVAWSSANDPAPDPVRHARRIGLDGPVGTRTDVFDRPRGFFVGGVGLAVGPSSILASTWDEGGCLVRLLDHQGAPLAPVRTLSMQSCAGVHAIAAGGFALFDRPGDAPAALHVLDAEGALVSDGPVLSVLDAAFWWGRARLVDGTSLVVGMHDGVEPTHASVQHVGRDGVPIGEPIALPAFAAASRARAIALEGGALVAWLEQPDGDPASQDRDVRVMRVDADGRLVGEPRVVAHHAYRDAGLSLVPTPEGGLFAVYVESTEPSGIDTTLSAVRLDATGAPLETLSFPSGQLARTPVARASEAGIAIAFDGPDRGAGPTQVFVTSLTCAAD